MAHVNLLPWREKQRQHQKQQYVAGLLAVAAIVGLIFWFIGQAIDQQISNQNSRNQYLEREIAVLDAQIAEIKKVKDSKNAIEQRMALIEQLQCARWTTRKCSLPQSFLPLNLTAVQRERLATLRLRFR